MINLELFYGLISNKELHKLILEHKVRKGIFISGKINNCCEKQLITFKRKEYIYNQKSEY
jgi:hypothetical protein